MSPVRRRGIIARGPVSFWSFEVANRQTKTGTIDTYPCRHFGAEIVKATGKKHKGKKKGK